MNRASLKFWRIALIFLAFATCSLPRPDIVGEIPIGLHWTDNSAILLTYFEDIHFANNKGEFRTFELLEDSLVKPLAKYAIPALELKNSAITVTSANGQLAIYGIGQIYEGFVVFGLAGTESSIENFYLGGSYDGLPVSLRIVKRDNDTNWLMFESAVWKGEHIFPLFEIHGTSFLLVDNDVVWAQCRGTTCLKLKLEDRGQTLSLYAVPTTAEIYTEWVTSVSHPVAPKVHTSRTFRICRGEENEEVVSLDGRLYSLSISEPSVTSISDERATHYADCIPPEEPLGFPQLMPHKINTPDGFTLQARPHLAHELQSPSCNCGCKPFCSCPTLFEEYVTVIEHSSSDLVEQAFYLHDPLWAKYRQE